MIAAEQRLHEEFHDRLLEEAVGRARRALAPFEADPLSSGSMSPTSTGALAASRAFAEASSLAGRLCRAD